MKRMLIVGATALLLGTSVTAMAQDPAFKPLGVSLRAGLFNASQRATRDIMGEGTFAFGIDYKIADLKLFKSDSDYKGSLSLSLDYYGRDSMSNVPVLLNYVGRLGSVYYTGGAGIGFNREPGDDRSRFAYAFGVGYEFPSKTVPFFVEAKYFGNEATRFNGLGVFIGARF